MRSFDELRIGTDGGQALAFGKTKMISVNRRETRGVSTRR